MRLFHYTCRHSAQTITRRGMLSPNKHPLLDWRPLLWLTDMETPDREGLGLTSSMLSCDRTEHRYVVDAPDAERWSDWAARNAVPLAIRLELEGGEGRMPDRWFVLEHSVLGILDRAYRQPEMAS
jgi:hypothetical protein